MVRRLITGSYNRRCSTIRWRARTMFMGRNCLSKTMISSWHCQVITIRMITCLLIMRHIRWHFWKRSVWSVGTISSSRYFFYRCWRDAMSRNLRWPDFIALTWNLLRWDVITLTRNGHWIDTVTRGFLWRKRWCFSWVHSRQSWVSRRCRCNVNWWLSGQRRWCRRQWRPLK